MELPVVNHPDYVAKINDDNKFPIRKFGALADYLIKDLADYFESINPNFHRGKFVHACHNDMTRKYNVNIKAS